jgi:putative pyruvate formate lyase activating enzyme
LCSWRCRTDRFGGETGRCGLGKEAYVAEQFLHCAEEPDINPSWMVSLQGCSWRCLYCQQYDLLPVQPRRGVPLGHSLGTNTIDPEARSLTFIGGNPDESAYAILCCLAELPERHALPVVWNTNGYGTRFLYRILDGVVDSYLPDLRYGNDECASRWSGVPRYWNTVIAALRLMAGQKNARTIVRILVLPGHFSCCHRPALLWLSENLKDQVKVIIKSEYYPTFLIQSRHGPMSRRPTEEEATLVRTLVSELGLRTV